MEEQWIYCYNLCWALRKASAAHMQDHAQSTQAPAGRYIAMALLLLVRENIVVQASYSNLTGQWCMYRRGAHCGLTSLPHN